MKYVYLSVAGISAVAAIVFLFINQDTLGLICFINCLINAVFYSLNTGLKLQDEKVKEQRQLIEALHRKVNALAELVREIEERGQLDYEYLRKQDNITVDTINNIETESRVSDEYE